MTDKPASPTEGDAYIIAASAINDWSGYDANIAHYQDGAWQIITAKTGWLCWVEDESKLYSFSNADWQEYAARKSHFSPDVMICEQMALGLDSTNAPATGWNQRYLNLLNINLLGSGVVLDQANAQFNLPIGNYWVKISSAAMRVGKHKADLKNLNNSQHLILGSCEHSEYGVTSSAALSRSVGEGELIVTDASHDYALMHHVETGDVENWRFGIRGEGPSGNCKIELWRL